MMNDAFDLRLTETHIEVHKFRSGAIVAATFLALLLQAFVPAYIPKFAVLDLPLLVTIYFGLSRRNPSTGLLLGMVIGLVQDSLSGPTVPLGLYGIAKTIIGYLDWCSPGYGTSCGAFCAHRSLPGCSSGHHYPDPPHAPCAARAMVYLAAFARRCNQRCRCRLPVYDPGSTPQELNLACLLRAS